MSKKIQVTVWNEYRDDQMTGETAAIYPQGLHNAIADFLNRDPDIEAGTSVITDSEQGLSETILDKTDVLVWWGHRYHGEIEDAYVGRVIDRVRRGMGIIFLHSAHESKPFKGLLGTSGHLSWREAGERVRIWQTDPSHPIAAGVPLNFVIEHEEMYSEPFGVPSPESTIFISWYKGGNVFRSGLTFRRDLGKIFYFQPGHETHPNYFNENVQKVITNAVKWAKPELRVESLACPNDKEPLENL
ncbi:trehalose utilization protein ThuA [Spirochaetia bacterium]|nr:trehalose utilization protein ThuA [Spirochaetia bacterium]